MTITVEMIVEKYKEFGSNMHGDSEGKIERYRAGISTQNRVEQLGSYLIMFESHERVGVLWEAVNDEPFDIFWPVFIEWWRTCDRAWAWRRIIIDMLRRRSADRPGIEFLGGDDRRFFDTLSWPLKVYRGCGRRTVRGIAWTIDRERAAVFASGVRF